MAKQLINTGLTANDGTGDTLRVAFNKVNTNTNELYELAVSSFKLWTPNTNYSTEELVFIVIDAIPFYLICVNSYTSQTIYDSNDLVNFKLVSQASTLTSYPQPGIALPMGTRYSDNGSLWELPTMLVTGPDGFDTTESSYWIQITRAGLPGTSWVEAERGINSNNPFSSILPKVDGSGSPYVWRFNTSGPVALDNVTIIGVRANRDRLWYHPSNDTWFHEKDPSTFQGANFTNAGTEGILPLPQQNDVYRSITGGGSWLFPFQLADTYPAPYVNEIHMGQGCLIKDNELYTLVADGDRTGVRLIPESTWATSPTITAATYNGNAWTIVGQPTSGNQECFVYANYDTFTWEFRGDGAWITTFTVDTATLLFTNVTSVRGTPHTSTYFAQPDINGNTVCTTTGYYQVIITFSSSEPAGTNVQLYLDYFGGNLGWINKANFNSNFISLGTGTLSVVLTEYFEANSSAFRLRTNLNVAGADTLVGNRNTLVLIKRLDN